MKPNYWYDSGVWTPYSKEVIQVHLDESQAITFIGRNNITVPLQKVSIWYGLFNTEETSCTNYSITFLNVDNKYRVYGRQYRWNYFCTYHWKHSWKLLYLCITWYVKEIHIGILDPKVNWFRGKNPEHNMTNQFSTLILRFFKKYRYTFIGITNFYLSSINQLLTGVVLE